MKELIVLVGPMASGKTTYCKKHLPDYYRVSQDDMGKAQYLINFKHALKTETKIVVDRINHLRKVRADFIDQAKAEGFHTKIIVMNMPYKDCYDRIMNRKVHPTLTCDSGEHIHNALTMYFKDYEYVSKGEADEIIRITHYDPYIKNISHLCAKHRTIIIGDPHGLWFEIEELLHRVNYQEDEDIIVFAGDLIDRGPKIKQVVDFVRSKPGRIFCVMGNHENKLLRHLRGNKVDISVLEKETLPQLQPDQELRMWLESLPLCIKIADNKYVVHAGVDPTYSIERQRKDVFLYARTFNKENHSVTDKDKDPWWKYPTAYDYKIYFGHAIYEQHNVSPWAVSLDGGAFGGGVLRAVVRETNGHEEIVEVKSRFVYKGTVDNCDYHEKLAPYEAHVQDGFCNKSEKGILVSYKYTDQATFAKKWDDYTRSARGIIFNKLTGECIAKPFSKFFNLGEMQETFLTNLPDLPYKVYDKLDGSLGILYWDNNIPHIATCGSFYSEQAMEATKILHEKYKIDDLNKELTLLFEIIYPANKIVCNYGDTRDIFLLAAFNRFTEEELNRDSLKKIAKKYGFPLVEQKKHTIEKMIKLQETLPHDKEGFVVRFENGLRVKIKGKEYLRIHKAISGCTPLNIWREMIDGSLPDKYKEIIPEEVLVDVETIAGVLEKNYKVVYNEICKEVKRFEGREMTPETRKEIGLFLAEPLNCLKHKGAFFPWLDKNQKSIDRYIMKIIKPVGNNL